MSILEAAIGWLAPPQCISCGVEGLALCQACASSEILPFGERCWQCGAVSKGSRTCLNCRRGFAPRFVWITTDYQAAAQKLIKVYKFQHLRTTAGSIAGLMVGTFLDFNSDEQIAKADYLIVPVPTATKRVRQRSFDHSDLLAKNIARKLGLKSYPALGRLGQVSQVGSTRSARLAQAEGQYFVRHKNLVKGRNLLLVDDVVTTGATLRAVTKVLRAAGARRVDALVFAKRL